ncbi:MAG: cyclic nucleotide-binding domain-containing protein [Pseudomonadota bacterium]
MYVSDYLNADHAIIRKLRAISSLNSFKDKDLEGIIKLSKVIKCEPGEQIIQEGQQDSWIYFLVSGKVGIQKEGETINVLQRRGDLFGEMGIIDGSPRSASILAIDETVCLAFDTSYMDRLEGNEKMAFKAVLYRIFAEILAERLRTADQKLVKIKEENARLKAELKALKAGQKE